MPRVARWPARARRERSSQSWQHARTAAEARGDHSCQRRIDQSRNEGYLYASVGRTGSIGECSTGTKKEMIMSSQEVMPNRRVTEEVTMTQDARPSGASRIMKTGRLREKVAIVTGASKGIGAGIALALGREGAAVAVNYSSNEPAARKVCRNNRGYISLALQHQRAGSCPDHT